MSFQTIAPNEVILMVNDLLPATSRVKLLQTCRRIFLVIVHTLYKHITVERRSARLLALTILTTRNPIYASVIDSLHYTGDDFDDMYLTYPLLVDAICNLQYLRTLALSIPRNHTSYFVSLVESKGLTRKTAPPFSFIESFISGEDLPSCRYTIPNLQKLVIDGDIELVKIGCHRKLTCLKIEASINAVQLGTILQSVDGNNLRELRINIFVSTTKELIYLLLGVSGACPNLWHIAFNTGMFNAMEISESLSSKPSMFPKIRTFFLNDEDDRPPIFGTTPSKCYKTQRRHLENARSLMQYLEAVSFGTVKWHYKGSAIEVGPWKSDSFAHDLVVASRSMGKYDEHDYCCLFLEEEKKDEEY